MLKGFGISKKSNSTLLFCSRDKKYKTPFGAASSDELIKITFPIKKSYLAEKVYLVLRKGDKSKKLSLEKKECVDGYDVFYIEFSINESGTYFYRFEIKRNNLLSFVGKGENGCAKIRDWLPEWQLSVYDSGYQTPSFQNGGIIYHIFVDRFAKKNQFRKPRYGVMKEWHEDVTIVDSDGVYRANDFFGGNLQGIISKLDYLKSLGVTMMYLSPIFESSSNHRYDTGDYSKIDPLLGDKKDFEELIKKAEEKGISIMLDGVFNHTGADSLYFNKFNHYPSLGAYQSKESPYYEWYTFYRYPDKYHCWWGITVVPTVSRSAVGYQNMIAGKGGILEKWTKKGVKGWRLDVVDELSSEFIEKIRSAIKKADKDALVIGEVWEDASTKHSYGEKRKYFRGSQLDGVTNYPFKEAILDYINNLNEKSFLEKVMSICENYPKKSLNNCMTLIGSHDTVRVLNALAQVSVNNPTKQFRKEYRLSPEEYNNARKKLLLASAIQYFLPGIPTIYYGDEIGMQGFEDPLNRRPFDFEKRDDIILSHYIKLGDIRYKNRELFTDLFDVLALDEKILFIKRGHLTLIVNPTREDYDLKGVYFDLLSENERSKLLPLSAVILNNYDKL
ncbi:MAG: glycoside hydrolase family 13 protein [Bacillota bacterium]|jgi:cyclomaltodextrinase|nr:glycoside hydrolase family 13 protein [Bacillota bacterium]HHU43091.1 glycoside hydrolase family 13 protein [Clostridiales bacterium]